MTRRVIALFACLVVSAGVIARADRPEIVPLRQPLQRVPLKIDDWSGNNDAPFSRDVLAVLGVDDYLTRIYRSSRGGGVGLYVGYYESQRQGDTMHSPQNCLPGAGWEPVSNRLIDLAAPARVAAGGRIAVNRYLIQKGLDRQLVLYWYQAHGRVVASEYWGKFYLIADAFRLNRTDGAIVRVTAPVGTEPQDEGAAESRAINFIEGLLPLLPDYLPG